MSAWKHKCKHHPYIKAAKSDVPSTSVRLEQVKQKHQTRNSHCWGAKQLEDTLLTSVVSLISKRKVWRSSDSVRNIFISSGVPTWKQALEVRAFSSSISFWKCAIYKVKRKKVQPLKHSKVWNKCHSSGQCFYYTINTCHFAAKAGNYSWTLTGKNKPVFQHSNWN